MKTLFKKSAAITLTILLAMVLAVAPAWATYSVKQAWVRTSATAGEALATGDVVCIADADGYAYEADANDSGLRPAIGIVGKGAASGGTVEIIIVGVMDGWSSLSEGAECYMSETASAVTQSAPSWNQQIGVALTDTKYFFNFGGAYLDASSVTSVGVLSGASPLIFEGATADAYETTMAITDPTADNTLTVPDDSGTVCVVGGGEDIADGIWGTDAGDLVFEGNTADAYEMTFDISDPASDVSLVFPDYSGTIMLSTLATNEPDAANAVTGASNGLVFEGATANAYETTIASTDATADRTITLPDGSGTVMTSSLATNAADAANAVTGASNALKFEGTADDYETSLSADDATADRTIALPDYTGAVPIVVQQGYTQFSHSEATTVDVTGAVLTLADGWFIEGKTFRVTAGGTVTGANGAITVALYLEDAAVCTLTTGSAAAGDWTAEFIIVATAAATQRIIGTLVAGAGTDPISDYAADTTDTATAGTIPLKLQVGLVHADDSITAEYWTIEYWNKAD